MVTDTITEQQQLNRIKLAMHVLKKVPQWKFDMLDYETKTECGTVFCFAGHMKSCGLMKKNDTDYERATTLLLGIESYSLEWGWLFDSRWRSGDNTPEGAAARMLHLVKGLPVPDNWAEQAFGIARKTYIPEKHK